MPSLFLFQPSEGMNTPVTVTTSPGTILIGTGANCVRFFNSGTSAVYVGFFESSIGTPVASNKNTVIKGGDTIILDKRREYDGISFIADTVTSIVHVHPGSYL
jgi:hypothetical protein